MADRSITYKIGIIGDSQIGKTCLASRFVDGSFSDMYITTKDYKVLKKIIEIDSRRINLQIWDLSGAEDFRTVTANKYCSLHGFMICYSVDKQESWNNVEHWLENLRNVLGNNLYANAAKVIVGLKNDSQRKCISDDVAVATSQSLTNADIIMTSAKNNECIKEAFYMLVERMYHKDYPSPSQDSHKNNRGQQTRQKTCFIF